MTMLMVVALAGGLAAAGAVLPPSVPSAPPVPQVPPVPPSTEREVKACDGLKKLLKLMDLPAAHGPHIIVMNDGKRIECLQWEPTQEPE